MESAATTSTVLRSKWHTLRHKGVAFPPAYQARGLSIIIGGRRLSLDPAQEELVYAWAKKKDTHYILDRVFQLNFLSDLKKLLPKEFQSIDNLDVIDFSEAFQLVDQEKKMHEAELERIRNLPREEKRSMTIAKRAEKEKLKATYAKAIVDDVEVDIANWLVEPPGLFMGRGQHPLRGRWKPRVGAQDVILNLGEDAPVPGGTWQEIVHDHSSTWLATWTEKLTGKRKYVWLHDSATLRQNNEKEKYDKANKLGKHINKVQREIINRMLRSTEINQKKIATVSYLIFKLAMRVGDEKDPEESDTVGASTLRVEHIKFPESDGQHFIEFNFLGKDSVPWQKTLPVDSQDTSGLYDNLKLFMKGKQPGSQIFDGITSSKVNAFLRSIDPKSVPGLTAKVFRTFITTRTVKEALAKPPIRIHEKSSEAQKIYVAKMANLTAAVTCNHKKGIDPKNPASKKAIERYENSLLKKQETIEKLKRDMEARTWKTEIQKSRLEQRLEKLEMQLRLQKNTRDYNLGTSLRNYIDPRVMKAWMGYVGLDWKKIYTSTLQRKFKWVEEYPMRELRAFFPSVKEKQDRAVEVVQEES
ncbi:MAG: DNA topoisomerase I [Thermoproteota archaeon]|jgi:DNA topoisomerase-1|nr:DNA topoisomerase I [Thermoproteota archaeon]